MTWGTVAHRKQKVEQVRDLQCSNPWVALPSRSLRLLGKIHPLDSSRPRMTDNSIRIGPHIVPKLKIKRFNKKNRLRSMCRRIMRNENDLHRPLKFNGNSLNRSLK